MLFQSYSVKYISKSSASGVYLFYLSKLFIDSNFVPIAKLCIPYFKGKNGNKLMAYTYLPMQ